MKKNSDKDTFEKEYRKQDNSVNDMYEKGNSERKQLKDSSEKDTSEKW